MRLGDWKVRSELVAHWEDIEQEYLPPEQDFQIDASAVTVHEDYEGFPPYTNDIALVKLPRMAEYNDGTQPACLPLDEAKVSRDISPNISNLRYSYTVHIVHEKKKCF